MSACRCAPPATDHVAVLVQSHESARTCIAAVQAGELTCPETLNGHFPGPSSPDRTTLLLIEPTPDGDLLHTWQLGDADPQFLAGPASPLRDPAWSVDGEQVLFRGALAGRTGVWRVAATGGPPELLSDAPLGDYEPHQDASGRTVFASSRDGNAEIYMRSETGEVARVATNPHDDVHPRFSPDGQHLAWLSDDERSRHLVVRTRHGAPVPLGDAGGQTAFAWAPDSGSLAVVERYGSGDRLVTRRLDGSLLHTFDLAADPSPPTWSADGTQLCWTSVGGGQTAVRCATAAGRVHPTVFQAPEGDTWLPRWLVVDP